MTRPVGAELDLEGIRKRQWLLNSGPVDHTVTNAIMFEDVPALLAEIERLRALQGEPVGWIVANDMDGEEWIGPEFYRAHELELAEERVAPWSWKRLVPVYPHPTEPEPSEDERL